MKSLLLAALLSAPAAAIETTTIANLSLMGGQYFFKGDRSSLNGNASALVAPSLRVSDRWAYLPIYSGNFQGTKGVGDTVGAGTIFQQQMDHRLSFSALHTPDGSDWKFKPGFSYKRTFMKETRDETWGKGLFDYDKMGVGFEAEKTYNDPFTYRLGIDLYRIHFMNFQSLESQAGTDPQGNPLGRERAGRNVLDSYNVMLSANGTRPFPYDNPALSFTGGYSVLFQTFPDQKIVDPRGQLTDATRRDFQHSLSAGVWHPRSMRMYGRPFRLDSRFNVAYVVNLSNQNTFDASRTRFVENSYSYHMWSAGPAFSLSWGGAKRPAWVNAAIRMEQTIFTGRLAQDSAGLYTSDTERQTRYVTTLAYAYPISQGFYLKAQSNMMWARSNQTYEKTYAYNYRTSNFLLGFTYEY